ncbi:MAG TPA: TRAP transporter substrate-binding protein DctP [Polyangiales bacterium]|nr:TRAP transporter substrate-binding protein DctP [Polyangiales bacterium]
MGTIKTRSIWILGLALLLSVLPSEAKRTQASQMLVIRVATLAPKASPFLRAFEELDQTIRQISGGQVGFEVYSSGVAGDESDVIRKMKIGQLDAAMVTSDGLGLMVPEVNVLRAPGIISNYVQLEAVTRAVLPEFNQLFEKNDYKLISWGEAGEYRYFSREPVRHPNDIKRMRPWLWPQSPVAQETWRTIGATPVPLGLPEVYGALSTKMIDLVESTSLAYVALQWHTTGLKYVTQQAHGMLMGAWVMNKRTFDKLSPELQSEVIKLARRNSERENVRTRKSDQGALRRLVERGYTATPFTSEGQKAFDTAFASVRKRLTQRLYPAPLISRVTELAAAAGH